MFFNPERDVGACFDEQLVTFKGRYQFCQYMPSWQSMDLKIWVTADVATSWRWYWWDYAASQLLTLVDLWGFIRGLNLWSVVHSTWRFLFCLQLKVAYYIFINRISPISTQHYGNPVFVHWFCNPLDFIVLFIGLPVHTMYSIYVMDSFFQHLLWDWVHCWYSDSLESWGPFNSHKIWQLPFCLHNDDYFTWSVQGHYTRRWFPFRLHPSLVANLVWAWNRISVWIALITLFKLVIEYRLLLDGVL